MIYAPGEHLKESYIRSVLSRESPVFFRDGKTKIGSFFQGEHRHYVDYQRIPAYCIKATVSSEDRLFFSHPGINLRSITRAVIANLKARRIVQGGSTITMQTAENLYKHQRKITDKFKELLNAFRLEAHYPKEKIIEFYLNQFFASGNGRGIGVAARYFFNKRVENLDLLECAFIASAIVNKPSYYNPFRARNKKERDEIIQRIGKRLAYVLRRMLEDGHISRKQYLQNRNKLPDFSKGKFRYNRSVIMDMVENQLQSGPITKSLQSRGITLSKIPNAGLQITLALDQKTQSAGMMGIRESLNLLDLKLKGYKSPKLLKSNKSLPHYDSFSPGNIYLGRLLKKGWVQKRKPFLQLELNSPDGRKKIVDQPGLAEFAAAYTHYKGLIYPPGHPKAVKRLFKQLNPGNLLTVMMRKVSSDGKTVRFNLHSPPGLQGGLVVLREGEFFSIIGGYNNENYNRAIMAKRQPGSTFKPLLFLAALQLQWSPLDILNNKPQAFLYQNNFYFPSPDHKPLSSRVSMAWTAIKSENLASVYLLYHLTDRLNPIQFKQLAAEMNMLPRDELKGKSGEIRQQYMKRIRDKLGIIPFDGAIKEGIYQKVKEEILVDLKFEGQEEESERLKFLPFGYLYQVQMDKTKRGRLKKQMLVLEDNFLSLLKKAQEMELAYGEKESNSKLEAPETDREIKVQGIRLFTLEEIERRVEKRWQQLKDKDKYSLEILSLVRDFKVTVGLRYLQKLCQTLGISSPLELVLSFPLGSNAISITELAQAYQTMLTGYTFRSKNNFSPMLIKKISHQDGHILYEDQVIKKRLLDSKIVAQIREMLLQVTRWGTGKRLEREMILREVNPTDSQNFDDLVNLNLKIPSLGKTGTANNYTNSTYAGLLPHFAVHSNEVGRPRVEHGYTIVSYVGYDDNSPMQSKNLRIGGAGGGLDVWSRTVRHLLKIPDYALHLDPYDLEYQQETRVKILRPTSLRKVRLDYKSGLPLKSDLLKDDLENQNNPFIHCFFLANGEPLRLFVPISSKHGNTGI